MKNILEIKMPENDAEADTIGDYFRALLMAIWTEGEGFSGKRPFGNSGWDSELYSAHLFRSRFTMLRSMGGRR